MDNVDVPHLFGALAAASKKTVYASIGTYTTLSSGVRVPIYNTPVSMSYVFQTAGASDLRLPGAPAASDNSVWYFHVEKPVEPPVILPEKTTEYYSLAPYLDRGFTVDDITTAIQTGWKMSGQTALPELNYHKETKLLIAFGEPAKLVAIDDVLKTLPQTQASQPTINATLLDLKKQVEELKKRLPPPAAAASNTITIPVGTPGQ